MKEGANDSITTASSLTQIGRRKDERTSEGTGGREKRDVALVGRVPPKVCKRERRWRRIHFFGQEGTWKDTGRGRVRSFHHSIGGASVAERGES